MRSLITLLLLSVGATACSEAPKGERGSNIVENDISAAAPIDTIEQGSNAAGTITSSSNGASDTAAPTNRDGWIGRWIGVEGLNLTVSKGKSAGHYSLKMQYGTDEDMSGTFDGVGTAEGIAFMRPDGDQVLRASTGDETGLKYLSGKTDCLKVKDGEGYCRK